MPSIYCPKSMADAVVGMAVDRPVKTVEARPLIVLRRAMTASVALCTEVEE